MIFSKQQVEVLLGLKFREYKNPNEEIYYKRSVCSFEGKDFLLTVNPKEMKINICNLWFENGRLQEKEFIIPQSALDSKKEFVSWIKDKIGA